MNEYSIRARENRKALYREKFSAQLQEWAAKMDVVKAQITMGSTNVRIDINNKIERWYEHSKTMTSHLEELRTATTETYDNVRIQAQKAWNEISNFMKTLEDKKDETTQSKRLDSRPLTNLKVGTGTT